VVLRVSRQRSNPDGSCPAIRSGQSLSELGTFLPLFNIKWAFGNRVFRFRGKEEEKKD
jgi:hypothetical protein